MNSFIKVLNLTKCEKRTLNQFRVFFSCWFHSFYSILRVVKKFPNFH